MVGPITIRDAAGSIRSPLQPGPAGGYVAGMDTIVPASFAVSARAATRIAEIVAAQSAPAALRVEVLAGGCSGFQYRFGLDPEARPDDIEIRAADARVVVDSTSLELLAGGELDYTD